MPPTAIRALPERMIRLDASVFRHALNEAFEEPFHARSDLFTGFHRHLANAIERSVEAQLGSSIDPTRRPPGWNVSNHPIITFPRSVLDQDPMRTTPRLCPKDGESQREYFERADRDKAQYWRYVEPSPDDLGIAHRVGAVRPPGSPSIEYLNRAYPELVQFPAIATICEYPQLSLGNVICRLPNEDMTLRVSIDSGATVAGYSWSMSRRKRNSWLALFNVRLDHEVAAPWIKHPVCDCVPSDMDEIKFTYPQYPILYICRVCGRLWACECFRQSQHLFRPAIAGIGFRCRACALCGGPHPKLPYGSPQYRSSFAVRYEPFIIRHAGTHSWSLQADRNELENSVREAMGFRRIGEQWITETLIHQIASETFPECQVLFHYRGKELDGLEIDIFIPDLRLAIEYQRKQHYAPVELFGGEDGLHQVRLRDARKKSLCEQLGYRLVEFRFDEDTSPGAIGQRMRDLRRTILPPTET